MNCSNCSAVIPENAKWCSACGQTAHIHRFNFHHILHEFFHALTHADKGFLYLLKELTLKPGTVLREYILEGKRKKYFNPFTFLMIILAISVIANSIFHPYSTPVIQAGEGASPALERIKEKQQNINMFFEKRSNIVTMLSTPVMAFAFWMGYRKRKLFYAEHLVAAVLVIGFITLAATLVFIPLMALTRGSRSYFWLILLNFIFQLSYMSWAYRGFLGLKGFKRSAGSVLVSLFGILLWILFSMAMVSVYFLTG